MDQTPPTWLWNVEKERGSDSRQFVSAFRQLPTFDKHRSKKIRFNPFLSIQTYRLITNDSGVCKFKQSQQGSHNAGFSASFQNANIFWGDIFTPALFHSFFLSLYFRSSGRRWHCRWHVNYCKPIIHLTLPSHFSLSLFYRPKMHK